MTTPPAHSPNMHQAAEQIVRVLREAGHTAYFAGGCVRDRLMGREPDDYDVATDAHPPRVLGLFPGSHYVGEAFGVVRVRRAGVWIEVATFRLEWEYLDGRRPARVAFTDAENDARRRDFTINGLFYDPVEDRVIDFVGGRADIDARVVRAIGDPRERFGEDYLRLLRAVRFAGKLGFDIEPATASAIRELAANLSRISRERIGGEVLAMLGHESRARAVKELESLGLARPVFGAPASAPGAHGLLAHLSAESGEEAALAAWLLDRHLPAGAAGSASAFLEGVKRLKLLPLVAEWRGALVLSNRQCEKMEQILVRLPVALGWFEQGIAVQKRLLSCEVWEDLDGLLRAIDACGLLGHTYADFQKEAVRLFAEGVSPEPYLSGADLIAAGLVPGPAFGEILERVYDAQLEGRVRGREQALAMALRPAEDGE